MRNVKSIHLFFGAIFVLVSVIHCARFNTYYNAQQYFKQAEESRLRSTSAQLSSSEIELYNKAINKASKVLTFHPKSKLVDDALLLMGKAFYHKGEFSKALRKFDELITNFPESNLVYEATFWLGKSYYASGDHEEAEQSLSGIVTQKKAKKWAAEAQFLLAEMAFLKQRYVYAFEEYIKVVKRFPKSSRNAEAQYRIGQCLTLLNKPYEARMAYDQVFSFDPHDTLRLNATFSIGQSLREEGRYNQAIEVFEKLLQDSRNMDYYASIRLEIADCEAEKGAVEVAISEYEKIIEDYPKSESSSEAHHRLGLIYLNILGDLDKAKEHLDAVKVEYAKSRFSGEAQQISMNIEKLTDLYHQLMPPQYDSTAAGLESSTPEQIMVIGSDDAALDELVNSILASVEPSESSDVIGTPSESGVPAEGMANVQPTSKNQGTTVDTAEVHFKLAELFLLQFSKADSALVHYKKVLDEFPESRYGAKSAYAIAWIQDMILNNGPEAQEAYLYTIESFPGTPYDRAARFALGERSTQEHDSSFARVQFLEAEEMLLRGGDVDSLIAAYQRVIDEYPDTPYAPKAGYAIAWILEYIASDRLAAEEVYEGIESDYRDTEYGAEAKIKLGMAQRTKKEKASPQQVSKEKTREALTEESLNLEDIERELLEEGPVLYTEPEVINRAEE